MSLQRIVKQCVLLAATGFGLAAAAMIARADGGTAAPVVSSGVAAPAPVPGGCCGTTAGCCSQDGCCTKGPCPAPLVHCTPKPPKIKFKCVCGKPICNPCDLEGYGYNPTCWRPWTPPLSCPGTPAATVPLQIRIDVGGDKPLPPTTHPLPPPQKIGDDVLPPPDR